MSGTQQRDGVPSKSVTALWSIFEGGLLLGAYLWVGWPGVVIAVFMPVAVGTRHRFYGRRAA